MSTKSTIKFFTDDNKVHSFHFYTECADECHVYLQVPVDRLVEVSNGNATIQITNPIFHAIQKHELDIDSSLLDCSNDDILEMVMTNVNGIISQYNEMVNSGKTKRDLALFEIGHGMTYGFHDMKIEDRISNAYQYFIKCREEQIEQWDAISKINEQNKRSYVK